MQEGKAKATEEIPGYAPPATTTFTATAFVA